jgi:hypothetical protein
MYALSGRAGPGYEPSPGVASSTDNTFYQKLLLHPAALSGNMASMPLALLYEFS